MKENIASYLKCIFCDKLLKLRQSFWITLYNEDKFAQPIFLLYAAISKLDQQLSRSWKYIR